MANPFGLTKANVERLIDAAFEAADNNGYCEDSVTEVLESMGFDLPTSTKTVTITVEVSGGRAALNNLDNDYKWNVYHDDEVETDTLRVVSVK